MRLRSRLRPKDDEFSFNLHGVGARVDESSTLSTNVDVKRIDWIASSVRRGPRLRKVELFADVSRLFLPDVPEGVSPMSERDQFRLSSNLLGNEGLGRNSRKVVDLVVGVSIQTSGVRRCGNEDLDGEVLSRIVVRFRGRGRVSVHQLGGNLVAKDARSTVVRGHLRQMRDLIFRHRHVSRGWV